MKMRLTGSLRWECLTPTVTLVDTPVKSSTIEASHPNLCPSGSTTHTRPAKMVKSPNAKLEQQFKGTRAT